MDVLARLCIDALVLTQGADDRIAEANPAAASLLGRSRDELIGLPLAQLWHAKDSAAMAALWQQRDGPLPPGRITARVARVGGEARLVTVRLTRDPAPQHTSSGPPRYLWTLTPLALRHNRHPLHLTVFDALHDSVFVFDEALRLLSLNASASRLLGLADPRSSPLGTRLDELPWTLLGPDGTPLSATEQPAAMALRQQAEVGPLRLSVRLTHDSPRWLTLYATPVAFHAAGLTHGVILTCTDITEQVAAETRLHASEQARHDQMRMLERLVDAAPGVVHSLQLNPDYSCRFLFASAGAHELLGYHGAELIEDSSHIAPHIQADDYNAFVTELMRSQASMSPLAITVRYQAPNSPEPRWIEMRAAPMAEEDGGTVWHGFLTDVTEQVRNREQIEHLAHSLELRVAERTHELEAKSRELESFTYSVSHDLKAPLRGIDGYSRLLLEEHSEQLSDEGRLFLRTIRSATQHMSRLIDDLLAYSRVERSRPQLTALRLRRCVDDALAERESELTASGFELNVQVGDEQVLGEHAGLLLALRNLLDNAIKFTAGRTPRRIDIGSQREGDHVTLSIRDNGLGFDMRYHDRIFDIFQRLQRTEDYPGTGVGLAIVRKAIERQHGRAWAESSPGQGALFFLSLPGAPASC